MRAIIFANGEIHNYIHLKTYIQPEDYIICADGGARHTYHMELTPHVILGDLDSIDQKWFEYYKEKEIQIETFPSEKDETDTELALHYAMKLNPEKIILMGCSGNRLDHTFANIHLLKQGLDAGMDMMMVDDNNEIYIVNNRLVVTGSKGDTLSLLPLSEAVSGIYATNLYYPVENFSMSFGFPIGISNVMLATETVISVQSGYLLAIKASD